MKQGNRIVKRPDCEKKERNETYGEFVSYIYRGLLKFAHSDNAVEAVHRLVLSLLNTNDDKYFEELVEKMLEPKYQWTSLKAVARQAKARELSRIDGAAKEAADVETIIDIADAQAAKISVTASISLDKFEKLLDNVDKKNTAERTKLAVALITSRVPCSCSDAAAICGISKSYLSRKLKQYYTAAV